MRLVDTVVFSAAVASHADLWIAAAAMDAGAALVTVDNVFRDVPGLALA